MTKPLILTDDDVARLLTPTEAVAVMEQTFLARAQGTYVGAPRWSLPLGGGDLVFTVGGAADAVGFRAYLLGGVAHDDQLVAVWDRKTGKLRGVVIGAVLGAMRTGAIGGVAVKHLARQDAASLALIGTGRQAYTQLRAALAVRPAVQAVRVFSRTPQHRRTFCEDMRELLPHLNIAPTESAEEAAREADIVICATTSREPILKGAWLKAGAHLSTIGPKHPDAREIDASAVERADFIVTDSPEQAASYPNGIITDGSGKPLVDLAAVVSRQAGRPSEDAITLFLSTGLAGTEVALAARVIEKAGLVEKL